ncbi:MAG: response regulator [Lachnospiraceae bacterium]|nr:response regulator [Lachnospiraceae bacterium]
MKHDGNDVTPHGPRIRVVNIVSAIFAVFVAVLFLLSSRWFDREYEEARGATEKYVTSEMAATMLKQSSDNLTTQVRSYTITQNRDYLRAYFAEVATSNRERAVETLNQYLADTEAYSDLENALECSVELMDREYYAMMLTLDATGGQIEPGMEALKTARLTAEDQNLGASEKLDLAVALTHGEEYQKYDRLIDEYVDRCVEHLLIEQETAQSESDVTLTRMRINQYLCALLLVVAILLQGVLMYIYIVRPIDESVKLLSEDQPLLLRGAYEIQYLESAYNNMYEQKLERKEQEQLLYDSMLEHFNAISDESLTVIRSNMTTGLIVEIRGRDLYPSDYAGNTIAAYAKSRLDNLLVESDKEIYTQTFDMEKLLERSARGEGAATMVAFTRRPSGRQCFVKYSGSASRNPLTGDVDAFGTETEYNYEMVNEVLDGKVLAEQYDMITYLVSGYYGVTIGDAANIKRGSIFPKEPSGIYSDYITDQVLPVLTGDDEEKAKTGKALSFDTIEKKLLENEPYIVDVACEIDGEIFNKRFMYYTVDREKHFYLLLKTDITDVLREQKERNELLVNALHEAEQANVAKTAFLSSMSHEIRTPMNAIIGLDSIALKDPDISEQTREYLTKIGGSAKHLLNLINDILDMSRIESGRMALRNEEFSFREMLEQINTMVGGQCQDKGLKYDCRITGHVDDYYIGDDMKLKQVIINILGNSVKFTPEGGEVSFSVEEVTQFEDKATMRFVMKDTGIGMDKEYLPKIFEAFSQEDSGKANKYGSTGLGMAITKNIVEMMNGDIEVESEKGSGTTFTVTVTLKKTDKKQSYADNMRPQDMRILVIDDDEVDCEHARLILGEIGISADVSSGGAEAIEKVKLAHARQEAYNLILVDWKMPEQDGIEVTRKIRKIVGNDSAIIILTAYSWDDVVEEALEAGVDSFMAKPLFATGVLDEFKAAIQKKNIGKSEEVHRAELSGRHILLAEDMMINAEIMKQLLAMREIKVDHAENGQLALEMFDKSEENYYAAILMDVRMPVMDGLAATQAIRALPRSDAKSVPIIAMTANAFDEDVQHSLQAGMNAHLSKPVEPEHLYETLETLIQ